jgi:hypothetical protein
VSDGLLGSELDAIVQRYLEELADALRRLPTSQRDHLVSEIREHIVEMRTERPVRDRSDMEALLNRVGLPEDIAAVALEGEEEGLDVPVDIPVAIPAADSPSGPKYFGGTVSKRMVLGGAVAAAVVVFALFLGFAGGRHQGAGVFSVFPRNSSAKSVIVRPSLPPLTVQSVPDVIGDTQPDAEATLSSAGLTYSIENVSSSVPVGRVISQDPSSGYAIPRRSNVMIVVSSGPPSTTS